MKGPATKPGWRWAFWKQGEHVNGAKLDLDAHAARVAEGTPPEVARKLVSEIRNAIVPLTARGLDERTGPCVERMLALALAMERRAG